MVELKELKFDGQLVPDIQNGSKTKTIRYEDEKGIGKGDYLKAQAVQEDGTVEQFAVLKVTSVSKKQIGLINQDDLQAHSCDTKVELLETLNSYYSSVSAHDTVKIINFSVK